MRMRHRVPMVFSLSMLDVFCCALGCVTLLWLVNQREAMLRAKANSQISTSLASLQSDYATTISERDRLVEQIARLRSDLAAANTRADKTSRELAAMTSEAEDNADRLSKATDRIAVLTREATDARKRAADLSTSLKDEEAKLDLAERRVVDLSGRLRDADALAKLVPALRESSATSKDKLTSSEARIHSLEADLEAARRSMAGVDTEKKDLLDKLARARMESENRFEGIALTGKRVVFLVDMSGSMELVDSSTAAPAKWSGVRDTLLKIFRSLPDLEKYQIILFSDQVMYPMGNEGRWLDPDTKSTERMQTALSSVRPKGNTNMYMALEAAFRFRTGGLDTIYLLSDGLPNVGDGLTPDAASRMNETQRSEVLGRVVRNALRSAWNPPQTSQKRIKINTVGFFYESPDVGAFLWALARENDGSFVGMSKP